jgi:hypothetical protein
MLYVGKTNNISRTTMITAYVSLQYDIKVQKATMTELGWEKKSKIIEDINTYS